MQRHLLTGWAGLATLLILSLIVPTGCKDSSGSSGRSASTSSTGSSGATTGGATTSGTTTGGGSSTGTGSDQEPPQVTFTAPGRGAHVAGSSVVVSGTVTDASGVTGLTLAGAPVAVDATGGFSHTVSLVPGTNVISYDASDGAGNTKHGALSVVAGAFLPDTDRVSDALALRLGDGAFTALEALVADPGTADVLEQELIAQNPVFDDDVDIAGFDLGQVKVDILSLDWSSASLSLDPFTGGITVQIQLTDLAIEVFAENTGGAFSFSENVSGVVSPVIGFELLLQVQGGQAQASVSQVDVQLNQMALSASGVLGYILPFVPALAQGPAEDALRQELEDRLPDLVADGLNMLGQGIDIDVAGTTATVILPVTGLTLDQTGLELVADAELVLAAAAGGPTAPGSLSTPSGAPTLLNLSDVTAAAADDLLNRLFYRVWRGGLLDLTVDAALLQSLGIQTPVPLTVDTLTQLVPGLTAAPGAGGNPVSLQLQANLPPTVRAVGGALPLEVGVGEVHVTLVADLGQGAQPVAEAALHFLGSAGLQAQGQQLTLDAGPPLIEVDVLSAPAGTLVAIEGFLQQLLPAAWNALMGQVGTFPIPSFHTLQPTQVQLGTSGTDYFVLEVDLP